MAVNQTKANAAKAQLDRLYWAWAWDKAEQILKNWWTTADVNAAMKKYSITSIPNQPTMNSSNKKAWGTSTNLTSSNSSRTTSPSSNKWGNTFYNNLSGKAVTSSTGNAGKWDTSYVQNAWYWREWDNWNKSTNVKNDPNRAAEIQYNIDQDAVANPGLFKNRADFDKYYKYDQADDTQKRLYDEAWNYYNQFWLTSDENSIAWHASAVADAKNAQIYKNAANKYSKLYPAINAIAKQFNDTLWPVIRDLQNYQSQYLNNMAALRKLQNDYYAGMKNELDMLAAGQSASVGSTLSGQWLSQSAIASTIDWIHKNWQYKYNSLMWEHVDTLMKLQDSESNFMTTYGNVMWNLSTAQNNAMSTWYNAFKDLEDGMESTLNTAAAERYSPYQTLTNAKVTGAAETLQSSGKLNSKQSEYQKADVNARQWIIYNQLMWLLGSDSTAFAKAAKYIATAVANNPNNWSAAVIEALTKWAGLDKATAQKAAQTIIWNDTDIDFDDPEAMATSLFS